MKETVIPRPIFGEQVFKPRETSMMVDEEILQGASSF
jgi:hypothetical protein